ncbi:DUF3667 domain-containing protein [Lysobacter fragariae]
MSETDEPHAAAPAPDNSGNCENCGTRLQGHYCHACGQSVHSPTRHFGHALEEVFESFWHLDGRVFRTLRDLLAPGRVALNYLAGQRVRYLPPVRLFLILSVLTFFVARLTVHLDNNAIRFEGDSAISQAQSEAEVIRIRDKALAKLAVREHEAAKAPGVDASLIALRARIEGSAATRIADLREAKKHPQGAHVDTPVDAHAGNAPPSKATSPAQKETAAPDPSYANSPLDQEGNVVFSHDGKPWNEKTNPLEAKWLPGFVNRWVNRKIGRMQDNIRHMEGDPDAYLEAFLGAVPTTLFLLMPVFALLLKVCYLGTGRGYLEHLVVALYSHAYLLITLLALFLLSSLADALPSLDIAITVLMIGLWLWIPVYLLLTQKRVYGQRWLVTTLRYAVIGSVYLVLVTFATLFAILAGITH